MAELDNIPEMRPTFDEIRRQDEQGKEYWNSRDLCSAMGYSAYWKFQRVINKAIEVANSKGMKVDDHFNQAVDMVKLGSGSKRKVDTFHLSRVACMTIAQNADERKPLVKQAREYFAQSVPMSELVQNSLSSNILLYKTSQGKTCVEVIFNSETFWMSKKKMAELYEVETITINYHLSQIYASGELQEEATIRKIWIVQKEGGYCVNGYKATQFSI